MTVTPSSPIDPDLTWDAEGLPRSGLYGDVYFSAEDGLAETRAVFLAGGGLPEAWAGRKRFTVAELGFGTGLNIAALLDLWSRERPPGGQLHIFSIEGHPISRDDAARALGRWPELAHVTDLLLARWPRRARGFHRIAFPAFDAVLDLAVMEAGDALTAWSGQADLWFLDGFAPAANPAMWRQEVLDLIAARSAPGARVATFTVAGAVRRGLAQAGFEVDKRPGFGRKRERLEARLPGMAEDAPACPTVAVIGAGIAGASLAHAFRALGVEATVHDACGPGGGASGNPAALVTPRLDAGLGPTAAFYAQAFAHAVDLYRAVPKAVIADGALLLELTPKDAGRFKTVAESDLFEPDALGLATAGEVGGRLGEPAAPGIDFREGLTIEPAVVLRAWTGEVRREPVAGLTRVDGRWRLLGEDGTTLGEADVVCIAAGHRAPALSDQLPLQPIRGQASFAEVASPPAASFGGYVIPTRTGLLFGATHDRDRDDEALDPADDARNLILLAKGMPALAARLAETPLSSRAAIRAATPDKLPIAGPVPGAEPGLFVLGGLGSRGFCAAPLLAAHIAAGVTGAPSPLPAPLADLVDPARFARRARRRTSL